MKPHPRIRKTVKWGGAAVTVLLVVVWIGSGWWIGTMPFGTTRLLVAGQGRITVFEPVGGHVGEDTDVSGPGHLFLTALGQIRYPRGVEWRRGFFLRWAFELNGRSCSYRGGTWFGRAVTVPAWPAVMTGSIITMIAWHRDALARRRARIGCCPKCNYDRTGLAPDAKCPECGTAATRKARPQA